LFALALATGCADAPPTDPTADDADLPSDARADLVVSASSADAVFVGHVIRIAHQVSQPDANALRLPFTLVTWQVDDPVRGVTGGEYTARFLGGPLGDKTLVVSEIPAFAVGDHDLMFMRDNGTVGCPLVNGARGRVRLSGAPDGLSPRAPSGRWLASAVSTIRADAAPAPAIATPDLDAPFVFAWPRSATHAERLAAAAAARERNATARAATARPDRHRARRTHRVRG